MPGPAPKPASRRSRASRGGLRTLSAVSSVTAPEFPLAPDATQSATIEQLRDRVAATQASLEVETDRRRRYRQKKQLERDQIALGIIELQVRQAADYEAAMWADLWAAPQAAIWGENPATVRELALYVRWMIRAEQGDTKAASEARQLSDRLGINPAALLKLRAEIENVDAAEDRGRRRRERSEAVVPSGPRPGKGDPRRGLFAV